MPSSCKSKYSILYNQLFACLISLVEVNQLKIIPGQFGRIERNDGNVWLFLLQKEDAHTLHLESHDHCKRKYRRLLSTSSYHFLVAPSKRSDLSGHYGVCMYVCMDGCMLDNCLTEKSITLLDNCLTEKSITYSHTQRNFF